MPFSFTDTATTEIYTLSLHDALPIFHFKTTLTGFKWIVRAVDAEPGARMVFGYEEALGYASGDLVRDKEDRKSTRLNSSHSSISYAVFCLKKKIHFRHTHLILSITSS